MSSDKDSYAIPVDKFSDDSPMSHVIKTCIEMDTTSKAGKGMLLLESGEHFELFDAQFFKA